MCGESSTGLIAEVGRVSVQGSRGEEDEVAGVESHAAWFVVRPHGYGTHLWGEVDQWDPGGDHFFGAAGEPAGFFAMPMVVCFS